MPKQEDQEGYEDKDKEAAEPPATINEALNSHKRLLSFKEHEPDANSVELTILMRKERSLQQQAELNRSQGTLNSWFK
ncbi:Bgt-51282 [Blumeria graminis f. sp. tritici]|uniref:Bgt-51282 n=2 Tax=Blumeria graminis TaxID=34373 RepID=A0A9X9PQJ6_BLUGR|nr:Bgt-51282 [Blumeria graminis f. sp. tritici]